MAATTVSSRPSARGGVGGAAPAKMSAAAALEVEQAAPLRGGDAAAAGAPAPLLGAYSHPLVVESSAAFRALLLAPLVVWWVAVFSGIWVYEGLPRGQKVYHAMLWFDKGLLRPAGPLVPFAVVVARGAVHAAEHLLPRLWRRGGGGGAAARPRAPPALALGSLLLYCMAVYTAMAVARIAIYLTHLFLLKNRYLEFHVVSDHIFLAATMLICLHAEIICLASDMARAARRGGGREAPLTLLFAVALFLYLFTAADMFYTAKYFHIPMESFSTAVIVFVLFQLPMLVWLTRQRSAK